MNTMRLFTPVLFAVVFSAAASAQQSEHRLGDHPAVIVKRLAEKQSYDYAANFYPHPAWLYLSSEAPRPMMDHPAVTIAKRERQRLAEQDMAHAEAQPASAVRSN
jgi:hypothetical protein